jgi:hypothetical protein
MLALADNAGCQAAASLNLKPTKKFEQDGHAQRRIQKLVGNHSETESRIPVMHKEVIVGVPHLIENKQPSGVEAIRIFMASILRLWNGCRS